ncbi:MAG TPA: hypothetical protein VJZ74_04100 [Pseudolabrys sp.]|nr:hypothetical protein [Pseudolabrys sp.]
MDRLLALACVGWLSVCSAQQTNISPLAFGMTPQGVAGALGTPLVRVSGRPGAEIYVAERDAGIFGYYPAVERIVLQFRGGALTGWKFDWRLRPRVFL